MYMKLFKATFTRSDRTVDARIVAANVEAAIQFAMITKPRSG
jgi:hypothetical protein